MDSLTRSDFFEDYGDAARQRGVWTGIPPSGRQVAGRSVGRDRRASDIIAFLGLGRLFVAHITGDLVVFGAHWLTVGFGQIGPLLSVPIFHARFGRAFNRWN